MIGLGGIGGVTALRIAASGKHTLGLAAGRHAEAIRAGGLQAGSVQALVERVGETLPKLDAPYDLILLATRTDDSEKALAPAAPLLAPDGAVVCLQNGLPEERAGRVVGEGRVLGTAIGWSASALSPGKYVVTGQGKYTLGGKSPRLHDAAAALSLAFPVRVTDNLPGARWSKLAMNCAMSTLGAVSGFSLGDLAAHRRTRGLALAVMREVSEVAHQRGVRLEPIAGIRPDLLTRLPAPLGHAVVWLVCAPRRGQRSGMIARLAAGRPAGVEDLNALIDRPLNQALVALVKRIERGELKPDPRNLETLP